MGLRRGTAAWGCAGGQRGATRGRSSVGLRGSAAWGCARALERGAAMEGSVGLRRGAAAWGCAGGQRGAAQGAAVWGCAGGQRGAAQGRSSAGLRRGVAWGRAGAQRGAAQGRSKRVAAQGCSSVGLRRGVAAWGCAGAQQHGAAQSSCVGRRSGGRLRRGASRGRVWARRGAAQGCSSVGLRRAAVWGGAVVGGAV